MVPSGQITLKNQKSLPCLDKKFLAGLKNFFEDLCTDDHYSEPAPLVIDCETRPPPRLREHDVLLALSKIKKTASGPDGIPYWVWKDNCTTLAPVIAKVWNLSLLFRAWPCSWKQSNINPLPKVDAPTQYVDFRGINITPVIALCFEKTVYNHFSKRAFEKNLASNQYTYRDGCNCTDALIYIQNNYLKALDDKNCTCVRIFAMDFSKAFDNVKHSTWKKT